MFTSRTRAELARPLFRMAPRLRVDVRILSRAQATAWDCPRRIVTVRSTVDTVGVAWFENDVWQIGALVGEGAEETLSSTRVVSDVHTAAAVFADLFRQTGGSRSEIIESRRPPALTAA
ncbi:hypothetical protein AS850_16005 [Frondihabitans sp. 762G35]|uniref:hypothetical protein n=1 Tax=Frondihabitans sp. 762G35 TaxID=1446794 RepID=UPI000D1FE63C|nr:hypothetical protein [Frondihabitans sp. 762G35]ARC58593.1 hypothetical protein AS850_16005 [Frondihabitans sp. 762G35]